MHLKQMEENLLSELKELRDVYQCNGIKSEFENEGSDYRDLILLRYLTAKTGLKLLIKIGGVEAFTDMKMAIHLGADGIVVPMVESEFAITKSQNMVEDILGNAFNGFDVYVNIETKTAVENLDAILSGMKKHIVKGITIGRSDLAYSYGRKGEQDSAFINQKIEEIIEKSYDHGMTRITVGGGISKKTFENHRFIQKIAPSLACVETRNVILQSTAIQNTDSLIHALDFERGYLNYKLEKNHIFTKADVARFDTLMSRG